MTHSTMEADRAAAVKRVNEALRGPVADILSRLMPELQGMSRADVYEKTLDDLDLLERSFEKFRSERHWFRHVVVDHRARPVLDDTVMLSCGRTLEEVIAMVVRSAAKRYFRRMVKGPGQAASGEQPLPAADSLYEAIKDYLMHEWQVPLVPAYADMSPSLVRSLGPKLLAIREMAELRRAIDGVSSPNAAPSQFPSPASAPAPAEAAAPVMEDDPFSLLISLDGRRLRPEGFSTVLENPEVLAVMGAGTYVETEQSMTGLLWDVGGPVSRILINGLKISPAQLVVMLDAANKAMGHQVFARLFGIPGQPELILRLVQQGLAEGIGAETSLADCARFIRSFVDRASRAGRGGADAKGKEPQAASDALTQGARKA